MTLRKIISSRQNRADSHLNSERLRLHTQGLHKFKPDEVLALRDRNRHRLPLSTKKLSETESH